MVVGILIALSINNFRQELENEKIRERLIGSLKKEFQTNHDQILVVLNNQENAIYSSFELLKRLNQYEKNNKDSLKRWTALIGNIWTFNAQNGVLNNAIVSGDILLLKSDSLKNSLFGWEGLANDINEEQERLFSDFPRVLDVLDQHIQNVSSMDYYADKFSPSKFPSDYETLMKDPQFENVLAYHTTLLLDHKEELETLKERSLLITSLLEKE